MALTIFCLSALPLVIAGKVHAEAKTFVLVHGAWHEGRAWDPVVTRLEQRGHVVFAPTLTGMSADNVIPMAEINLSSHIDDVISLIEERRLADIILVGHSYGGIVISGVLGRNTGRVAKAVYLDALVIENGQSLATAVSDVTPAIKADFERLAGSGLPVLPPPEDTWEKRWGLTPDHLDYARALIHPHPPLTFLEPVYWEPFGQPGVEYIYIKSTQNPNPVFIEIAEKIKADTRWRYLTLDTHHDAMILAPDDLTDLLTVIAQ